MEKMERNSKKKKAPPTFETDGKRNEDSATAAKSSTAVEHTPKKDAAKEETCRNNDDKAALSSSSSSAKKLKVAPVVAKTEKKESSKASHSSSETEPLQGEACRVGKDDTTALTTSSSPSTPQTPKGSAAAASKNELSPSPGSSGALSSPARSPLQVLDLESALYKVTLLSPTKESREYLTPDDKEQRRDDHGTTSRSTPWITFRLAHMGDAATLAALYCRKKSSLSSTTTECNEEQISLWLAEGLGDEDTPPSVFGLLAEVHQDDDGHDEQQQQQQQDDPDGEKKEKVSTCELGAALLLSAAWQNNQRVIRIEWYSIEPAYPNLAGFVWLRLASLSLWTNSALAWTQPFQETPASTKKINQDNKNTKASLKNA